MIRVSMEDGRPGVGALAGTAFWSAMATGIAFLVGYLREDGYYGRLGVNVGQLGFPFEHFMMKSFGVLLAPALYFVLVPAVDWMFQLRERVRQRKRNPTVEPPPTVLFRYISPLAGSAAIAVVSGLWALAGVGDGTPVLLSEPWEMTLLDALLLLSGLALVSSILRTNLSGKETAAQPFFGKDRSAQFVLGALTVLFLCLAGQSQGVDAGSERAWACVPLPVVAFVPAQPALDPNRTYWLIARAGGAFLVRDVWLAGNETDYVIIPDTGGTAAKITPSKDTRSC